MTAASQTAAAARCLLRDFSSPPVLRAFYFIRRSPAPAVLSENKRPTGFYVFILSYAHMLCQATEYFSSTLAKKRPPRREIAAGRNERTFCVRQIPGHVISRTSYPLRCFAPPPLTSLFRCFSFAHKRKATRILRKDLTERQPRARGALLRYIAVFPPSLPRWGKVPFLSCSCSAFRKGKNPITSDGIFANLCQRFDLPYRKRTFLSPPVLRTTSPYISVSLLFFCTQKKSNENSAERFNGETTACARSVAPLYRASLFAPMGQSSCPRTFE